MLRLNPVKAMNHPFLTIAAREKAQAGFCSKPAAIGRKWLLKSRLKKKLKSEANRGGEQQGVRSSLQRDWQKRQLRLRSVDWSHGNSRLHNWRGDSYRGSVSSASRWCKAAQSSNIGSASQWRPSTWADSDDATRAELSECYESMCIHVFNEERPIKSATKLKKILKKRLENQTQPHKQDCSRTWAEYRRCRASTQFHANPYQQPQ